MADGMTYRFQEVGQYVADDDLRLIAVGFPKDVHRWKEECLLQYRPNEEILLEYHVVPTELLGTQIQEIHTAYCGSEIASEHNKKIGNIIELIRGGRPVYPFFIQKNDPQRRIVEGYHRAVALWLLRAAAFPVFLTKYSDW